MLRVGIIGLGDIALVHLPLINQSDKAELVAVCDIDESKKDMVPNVTFYQDYKVMVEQANLDVVHVCLPHYLHYPITKYLVEHKVNVLQEKPLTLDYQEAKMAMEINNNSDVKVAICFQNRRNETFVMLKEIVDSKKYGELCGIKGIVTWARPKAYYDVKPWRGTWEQAGGGSMINQSIHTLDLIQLLGKEIESVKASSNQLLDYGIEVEDTVVTVINFVSGAKGFFMSTNASVRNDAIELKVYFKDAELVIRNSKLYLSDADHDEIELVEDSVLSGPKSYYGASHKIMINEFYDCIINDTQGYVTTEEAAVAIKLIDAIQLSSKENRLVKMEEIQ